MNTVNRAAQEADRAKALLARAVDAKGGLDKLKAIKTIVVRQTLLNPAREDSALQTTAYIQYPDRFRTDTSAPVGAHVQIFDGSSVWVKADGRVSEMPEAVARDARATLRRDPIALLVAASDGALTPRLLPDVKDANGKRNHALELSAPDLNPVVVLVDPETSQINKITFVADTPGRPILEDEFSDYRPVDGVQIAFRAARRAGPQVIERRIIDVKINAPIDPALFKRPS